ncbi:MAG: NADH-quinone oxidoreductase subunit NuoF [Leptospirales bacterium]|jgi:NADH-quinone oxidoreductase subunit F
MDSMQVFEPVLTRYIREPNSWTLSHYESRGGYRQARAALTQNPEDIIKIVLDSGLRGRGGAGFPTGRKWTFLAKNTGKPTYLVVNGDESEPGTFKDRYLVERDPHQLLEGMIIASYAIGCHHAFCYLRGEFFEGYDRLKAALDEIKAKNYVGEKIFGSDFDLKITLVRGAGAYICGEETGMLSSIEGDRGYPKLKPPFPAVSGLFGAPTIVNNVETICNLPHLVEHGADWYKQWGTEKSPGFKIFSVSGHVRQPGNFEVPLGTPLMTLIEEYAGGVLGGKGIKAVIPGGSSTPLLTGGRIRQANMDYESIAELGSFLGSGGVTVLDEDTDMVDALWNLMRFYHHESCGQCTPCREGTGWLEKIIQRVFAGGAEGADLDLVLEITKNMRGRTICALADAAAMPAASYISEFRQEFESKSKRATTAGAPGGGISS